MLATATTTPYFLPDQQGYFELRAWDTPSAALENATSTEGLQLRVKEPTTDPATWTTWVNTLKAVSADVTAETAFTGTTGVVSRVADGRVQTVEHYWGAGAPNWWGATQTGRVAVCFRGTLVAEARRQWFESTYTGAPATLPVTFGIAGSGWVRIDTVVGGVVTTRFRGDVSEQGFLEFGLKTTTVANLAAGTEIRVYYVQSGAEPWGGLVVKAYRGTLSGTAQEQADAIAAAPVLSGGLFAYGSSVAGTLLSFISDISVTNELNAASQLTANLPLINPAVNDGNGWRFERPATTHPGYLVLYENGSVVFTLKRKRLVQLTHFLYNPTTAAYVSTVLFTGHVHDFAEQASGNATVECRSFEGRMVEQYDQLPDRISYMSRNFRVLDFGDVVPAQRAQPVYNVPAFDNWPLAFALEELGTRAGIDASVFRTSRQVVQAGVVVNTNPLTNLFDARVLTGDRLRLPRAVNYGNVGLGFTETRPIDDPYVFKTEPTHDLWQASRDLIDRVGYRCRFDERGRAQLYPANVPDSVVDFTTTSFATTGTQVTHAGAYGAYYVQTTAVTNSITSTVYAARIDVSLPRAVGVRSWNYTVTRVTGSVLVASGTLTPADASLGSNVQVIFEAPLVAPEANTAVATLYSGGYDQYTVVLTPNAVAGTAMIDCLLLYVTDPINTVLPVISTATAAISVTTEAQQDATRNKITVVGRRKSAVTDSDKFAAAKQPTEQEFVAQNAVDVGSITDPTAYNYVGYLKHAVIYDEAISDDGFARYIAQAFLYRQAYPRPGATIAHPILPFIQPGDPLLVDETKFKTVAGQYPVYVSRVSHSLARGGFKTTLTAVPWPDFPAYMPRLDIDLAAFNDEPVTNINLSYTSLSGHTVTNADMTDYVIEARDVDLIEEVTSITATGGTPPYLIMPTNTPWPPVPGTVQLKIVDPSSAESGPYSSTKTLTGYAFNPTPGGIIATLNFEPFAFFLSVRVKVVDSISGSTTDITLGGDPSAVFYMEYYTSLAGTTVWIRKGSTPYTGTTSNITLTLVFESFMDPNPEIGRGYVTNNPYHQFMEVDYRNASAQPSTQKRIYLPWNQGDASTRFDRGADQTTFNIGFRALGPTDGSGTLLDPYAARNDGTIYSPFYDPYTSELGNLVKTEFDVLADGLYRVSVRSALDDTVVAWLTNPAAAPKEDDKHWQFLAVGSKKQLFWDGVDQRGEWNIQQSELYSSLNYGAFDTDKAPRVGGGYYAWNAEVAKGTLGPLAYIWMKRDANTGKPLIGQGTYGAWYIHVEARTEIVDATVTTKGSKAIFTHLPEPTKIELKVDQYNGSTWVAADYTTTPTDATIAGAISNTTPIRLRFKVAPRPGVFWDAKPEEVAVKLTRVAHMRVILADQTVLFKGIAFPGSTAEDTTIVNRRLTNDSHTNNYVDTGYRKAHTLRWTDGDTGTTEWTFQPSDFKREFRFSGIQESVEFGNYLQLEEVPGWNASRETASSRSRLQLALMSYLFYLSAYATDRSGRSTWAMNRSFLDLSKITNNAYANWWNPTVPTSPANSSTYKLPWPDDPAYQQRRSVVCRQWTGEGTWKEDQRVLHGFSSSSLAVELFQHFWWQHEYDATTIGVAGTPKTWASFGLQSDLYSATHASKTDALLPASFDTIKKQLGVITGGVVETALNSTTTGWSSPPAGGWQFETSPGWIPSITRDFHPYHMLPPMLPPSKLSNGGANPTAGNEADRRQLNFYTTVDGRDYRSDTNEGADVAATEVWSSPVYAMELTAPSGGRRFWPGYSFDAKGPPLKNLGLINNALNYLRQDETVHWEDLRGVYSRSARPAEAPVKVPANLPYYINQGLYDHIDCKPARKQEVYPKFGANITKWFRIAFRHEYLWESGTMFPCDVYGKERLDMSLWWLTRFHGSAIANRVTYDHGAWTGWKDDHPAGYTGTIFPSVTGVRAWRYGEGWSNGDGMGRLGNPFEWGFMPIGVGPVMPTTTQLLAHLVLVVERRGGA